MKKYSILLTILIIPFLGTAQLRHSFSLNEKLYSHFFSGQPEQFRLNGVTSEGIWLPMLNYRVGKGKHELEAYWSHANSDYFEHEIKAKEYNKIPLNSSFSEKQFTGGINYGYQYYLHKRIRLSVLVGINYGRHSAFVMTHYSMHPLHPYRAEMRTETHVGLQLAHNIQIPIWKEFFGNMNIRYTNVPWAKYKENRQNMIVEVGLGYGWQRK